MLLILIQSVTILKQSKKNQPHEKQDEVKITKAVYDTGPELFLLNFQGSDSHLVDKGSVPPVLIYYEPVSNVYYRAKMTETNGIAYEIDPEKQEKIYFPELSGNPFDCMYAGNISPTERLYIDTNDNNRQYIKTLKLLTDHTNYLSSSKVITSTNSLPVYPVLIETTCVPGVYYTNANGDAFYRDFVITEDFDGIALNYAGTYQSFFDLDQCCPDSVMMIMQGFVYIKKCWET